MIRGVPYDAEVEYLESTGLEYIDTGKSLDAYPKIGYQIKINPLVSGSFNGVARGFCGFSNNGSRWFGVNFTSFNSRGWQIGLGNSAYSSLDMSLTDHTILVSSTAGVFINGVDTGSAYRTNVARSGTTFLAFAICSRDSSNVNHISPRACRIYYLTLYNNSDIILDFVPVRFTNELGQTEGAMYDRVTRRLFRNQGTGAFLYGADVATPVMALHMFQRPPYTARDYVQKGLVAHWDGVENAGWGVHDVASTIWKDLVGNADLTCETDSVSDSWIRYSKSVQITLENPLVTGYPFTIQGVYDRTETTGNFCALGFGFGSARLCTGSASTFGCRFATTYNTKNIVGPRNAITWLRSSADGDKVRIFADGNDLGLTNNPQGGDISTLAKICINGENQYGNYRNVFSVGNIRIYNRALTAEEIARNYAVDKERFKLP